MVGGFAVNFHGFQRFTSDVDLLIEDTLENRQKLRQCFLELGIGDFEELERIEFIAGWTDFKLTQNLTLDLMTSIPGISDISFDELLDSASIAILNEIKVPFLHINHLIMAKKATNRPKDQIDLIELEKIKMLRSKSTNKKT